LFTFVYYQVTVFLKLTPQNSRPVQAASIAREIGTGRGSIDARVGSADYRVGGVLLGNDLAK
jgi:hypothetical protein